MTLNTLFPFPRVFQFVVVVGEVGQPFTLLSTGKHISGIHYTVRDYQYYTCKTKGYRAV